MEKLDDRYVFDFLTQHMLGTLVTQTVDHTLHAAPIYFDVTQDFDIYFVTSQKTQKFVNLTENPHVILTVTNEAQLETVQIRGTIEPVSDKLETVFSKIGKKLTERAKDQVVMPIFKMDVAEPISIHIKPLEIRLRSFQGSKLREHFVALK